MRIGARYWVLLCLLLFAAPAPAAVRAWLEPDHISLGQTAMLKVETDDANARPDFSGLEQNFELRGQSSGTHISIVNGRRTLRILYSIALVALEPGVITIPSLRVGNETTEPLQLTVVPAAPGSALNGDDIFIETDIGTSTPYVQQAVSYTVRLFYALPLIDGSIETGTPEHASLQQVGADRRSTRDIGGRRYNVFERDLMLVPEQSGQLELPAARFRGHAQSTDMNAFFGGAREVNAVAKRVRLDVRPRPPTAPAPWLPATALTLARNAIPDDVRAGEPLMVELTLTADGATSAQLPALEMPAIPGAQVFPEQPQSKDSVAAGQPVATLTRRFAIVPSREGVLKIPEIRVAYWNTRDDKADAARLEPIELSVQPGSLLPPVPIAPSASSAASSGSAPTAVATAPLAVDTVAARNWQLLSALLGLALLLALAWGWRRGAAPPSPLPTVAANANQAPSNAALRSALARSDLGDIAAALRASMAPAASNLGELRAQLGDGAQIKAVDELERVLWAPGVTASDRHALLAQLRTAFKEGVRAARRPVPASTHGLPPLYPRR